MKQTRWKLQNTAPDMWTRYYIVSPPETHPVYDHELWPSQIVAFLGAWATVAMR